MGKKFVVNEHLGELFGYFTLIGETSKRTSSGGQVVLCRCVCGIEKEVSLQNIKNGNTKSCGCKQFSDPRWKDETGNKYGNITVISFNRTTKKDTFWNVRCSCGKEWVINRKKLWKGQSSCFECSRYQGGAQRRNYIVGNYYGFLKVLEDEGYKNKEQKSQRMYKCLCDCGNITSVAGTQLTSGKTRSCGCMMSDIAWDYIHKKDACKIGCRVGSYTILREDENTRHKYHCRCICGYTRVFMRDDINLGNVAECPHCKSTEIRSDSISGKKFGKLTAVKVVPKGEKSIRSWLCKCECGATPIVTEQNLLRGISTQCATCRNRANGKKCVKDLTGMKFGILTVVKRTDKNKSGNVQWICKCDCGETTVVSSSNLLRNHTVSCGCVISTGEVLLAKALRKNKIKFVKQKKFDGCVDKGSLKFDFYLPDYGWCIECNGHQHYRPVEWFGGEEQFDTQKRRDKIKYDFCKSNFIPLIRIHYSDYKEMDRVADSIDSCLKRLPPTHKNINVR